MDSSGEGEDFLDIWLETLWERECDQRGSRGSPGLPHFREIAERHGVCGKDGKRDVGSLGGYGRVTWKMQVTG